MKVSSPGKQPVMQRWRTVCAAADEAEIRRWDTAFPGCLNTGILCGPVIGTDIDVLDPALAAQVEALAAEMLGETPLRRVGQPPKRLLVYRAAEPGLRKAQLVIARPDGDQAKPDKVELLADGQQFVAYGTHPVTLRPYRWADRTPETVPLSDLPAIAGADMDAFLDAAAAMLRGAGCVVEVKQRRGGGGVTETPPPPLAGRDPHRGEDGGTRYGLKALADECDAIRRAAFGAQEETLNAAALKIGGLVAGGELRGDEAAAALIAAGCSMAPQPGREPWTRRDVEAKVRRALADGTRSPRQAPLRPEPPRPPGGPNLHELPLDPAARRRRELPMPTRPDTGASDEARRRREAERLNEADPHPAGAGAGADTSPPPGPAAEGGADSRTAPAPDAATAVDLDDLLGRSERGAVYPTVHNALLILQYDPALAGMLSNNEFSGEVELRRPPPPVEEGGPVLPGPYPRKGMEEDTILVLAHIQRRWSPCFGKETVRDAMHAVSRFHAVHPVRDWLASLAWDGTPRLDRWLCSAFGVPDDAYHRAVGAKFLVAAVRRVRRPGSKFDCMPVLEGRQGIGKSRAVRALFGAAWFADTLGADISSKDAAIGLMGRWCVELAEIEALIRAEVEVVKAFLSRAVDRYRPVFGKASADFPRQAVLIGTTNKDDYLKDETGNRRFWPVRCEFADVAWTEANRAQLWAEAAVREAAGETAWLDDAGVAAEAEAHQNDRLDEDVWTAPIRQYLAVRVEAGDEHVLVANVLRDAIGLPADRQDKRAQMRAAKVLKAEGWTKDLQRPPRGKPTRLWLPPTEG
jgi:putative DNA primase/helicase